MTHTNPRGLYGALLQAHALRRVIRRAISSSDIDATSLIAEIRADLEAVDMSAFAFGRPSSSFHVSALEAFKKKLDTVLQFATQPDLPPISQVARELGTFHYHLALRVINKQSGQLYLHCA